MGLTHVDKDQSHREKSRKTLNFVLHVQIGQFSRV